MDKLELIRLIGNEVCEGCGPDEDCGFDEHDCQRLNTAIMYLDEYVEKQLESKDKFIKPCKSRYDDVFEQGIKSLT